MTVSASYIALERLAAARELKEYTNRPTMPARPLGWLRIRFGRYVNLLNRAASALLIIVLLASLLPYQPHAKAFIAWRMTQEYRSERWNRIQTRFSEVLDFTEEKELLFARAQALWGVENSSHTLLTRGQALENSGQAAWMRVEERVDRLLMARMMNSSAGNRSMGNCEQNLVSVVQQAETIDFGKWMEEGIRLMIGLFENAGRREKYE